MRRTDGWEGQAVGYFLHDGSCRAQGWGGDVDAHVAVDHDGTDDVERGVDDLEDGDGFGEFPGLLHLGNEPEEGRMAHCMLSGAYCAA